ncbi:uncharacterized protein ColSpa_01240 [Colletotrichum spaethianum]|uniref:Accumulation-associated protein n=1 Tax=Colletotrichum spaethianum TaxID=700344 RepID=A0AA37P6Y3_9PEZI|nr:uncharacterized protein ColSpa_01240 [Colletotrichum spaethianum]GKT41059.1 hypothetical protein ColSpa_01240 [Colletotrichum spaethianum]
MKFSTFTLFSSQVLLAASLPLSASPATGIVSRNEDALNSAVKDLGITKRLPAEAAAGEGAAGGAEGGGAKEGEAGEKEIEGQFIVPKNGRFEVEFQNAVGRTLTVTENRSPAAPPPGFTAVEPVSYQISLAEGAQGVKLSKVDYIINPGNALDISKGQIGRLFPEINAFIIDPALGELEFEAEENELTLTVANMNGEFAVFLPQAAAA